MKLILSRKGFDSSSGGTPSPIFPDGRMLSLPIPDKQSAICYSEISYDQSSIGPLVSQLSGKKIPPSYRAHLDPDLRREALLPRDPDWRPVFGQTGAAQGHLRRQGVAEGDIFLFFGLFRPVLWDGSDYHWDTHTPPRHVLWGWLQIDQILAVDSIKPDTRRWASQHPHLQRSNDKNNTLYIARKTLAMPVAKQRNSPGAGTFPHFKSALQLTSPKARKPSTWLLPAWFFPRDGRSSLTYHDRRSRWRSDTEGVELESAARGQEFVLDCQQYPEAPHWIDELLTRL
jgi:hypothetical protein